MGRTVYMPTWKPESTIHVGKYTTHGSYGNWFTSWSTFYSWIAKSRWDGRNTAKFKWNFRGFAWFLESRWCCERVVSWSCHPYVYHSLKLLVTFSPLKMDENGWLEDEISRDNPIFWGELLVSGSVILLVWSEYLCFYNLSQFELWNSLADGMQIIYSKKEGLVPSKGYHINCFPGSNVPNTGVTCD